MKLVKMSLMAAVLLGSSVYAMDNVNVDGDARLYYGTTQDDANMLFDKAGAVGQSAVRLSGSGDFSDVVSAKATVYGVSTLGLENTLVAETWTGGLKSNYWFSEAYLQAKMGETTAVAGRIELDTPLLFTETWSIAPNTFESAVVMNQDIPDTTLVAAFVGRSNAVVIGGGTDNAQNDDAQSDLFKAIGLHGEGAYAFGAVNNSWEPLTVQAWYYLAPHSFDSYWVQADMNFEGVLVGA